MILTPPEFTPLLDPVEQREPLSFVFREGEMLVREADRALPDAAAWAAHGLAADEGLPLGLLAGAYCRVASVARDTAAREGHAFVGLRSLFGVLDEALLGVAFRAAQVAHFARTHRFCGACGGPTERVRGEQALRCSACGHAFWPRISPAMMVLVRKGEAILLARHAKVPHGRYTALAGFVEPGESVEDAVHREVREEVGLEVTDLRYFASQSWPFPHSLMLAFTAEHAGGEIRCDPAEIAEARWFGPGQALPELSIRESIARALIDANLPRASRPASGSPRT